MDDVQDIKNLVYSYAELLDTGDLDALGKLFAHAVIRTPAGHEFHGAAAARAFIEQRVQFYGGIPRTKQLVTNVIVEIDDSRRSATARSYYTVLQAHASLSLQSILSGRWHDRFDRIDGQWRFIERRIFTDLTGNVSCHLRAGFPDEWVEIPDP
jgi:3-phenylpropionate/cinnamic acid dioxygenase small subunit